MAYASRVYVRFIENDEAKVKKLARTKGFTENGYLGHLIHIALETECDET